MIAPEGTVLFETKSGVKLEVKNGGLYTTNEPEIRKALEEDLASDNPMDVQMAESVCALMQKYGLVAEASNQDRPGLKFPDVNSVITHL